MQSAGQHVGPASLGMMSMTGPLPSLVSLSPAAVLSYFSSSVPAVRVHAITHWTSRFLRAPQDRGANATDIQASVPQLVDQFAHEDQAVRAAALSTLTDLLTVRAADLADQKLLGLEALFHSSPVERLEAPSLQVHDAAVAALFDRAVSTDYDAWLGSAELALHAAVRVRRDNAAPLTSHETAARAHILDRLASPGSDRARQSSALLGSHSDDLTSLGLKFGFAGVPTGEWPGIWMLPRRFEAIMARISRNGGAKSLGSPFWGKIDHFNPVSTMPSGTLFWYGATGLYGQEELQVRSFRGEEGRMRGRLMNVRRMSPRHPIQVAIRIVDVLPSADGGKEEVREVLTLTQGDLFR